MRKTADAARGKWRGILQLLGVDKDHLTGKHGPCPMCGGTDRFRFDNDKGNGTYICGQCGAGNGFDFLMKMQGWTFQEAATEVDKVLGEAKPEPVKKEIDPEYRRNLLNSLWTGSKPLGFGDPVDIYLRARGVQITAYPEALRFSGKCRAPNGKDYPAMLAMVTASDGSAVSLHRTFLGCAGKADMPEPRAMMPGQLANGCCIRLSAVQKHIGIAEGIETALRASELFNIPVWAVINSTMMQKWIAPAGVEQVTVFGDNDPMFGGQAAAYGVAHRLSVKGIKSSVEIPDRVGMDWADIEAA